MKRIVKFAFAGLGFVAVVIIGIQLWAGNAIEARLARQYDVAPDSLDAFKSAGDPVLGKRIVEVRSGCVDCHGEDLAGRTFIEDPAMGKVSSSNLTPAALSSWTDDEIGRAIRHGIGKDGRALFFMPATDFNGLSGGDLASVVAYLRSIPPVERAQGETALGPLGRVLVAANKIPIALTAETIDHKRGFNEKPAEMPTAEFGHYLAQACTGCHNEKYTGGPIMGAPPDWAPASDLTRLGSWSEEDFVRTMRTGTNPKGAKLRMPFPLALTSQMSDLELKALWAFLSTLTPPTEGLSAKMK